MDINTYTLLFSCFSTLFFGIMVNVNAQSSGSKKDLQVELADNAFARKLKDSSKINRHEFSHNRLGLKNIIIPNSVTEIGVAAFGNNELESVVIPEGVTIIDTSVFCNNRLANVVIPKSVIIIKDQAFLNNRLTSVTFHEGLTDIGESAFENNKLTSITIPKSVKRIREEAFAKNNLKVITIGANVELGGTYGSVFGDYAVNSFDGLFDRIYKLGGRRAGTYVSYFGIWIRQ